MEKIKKNKKVFGLVLVFFLFLFPIGLFNKDKQSETVETKTQAVQPVKQEEIIKEIFNKNTFLGKINKIEKIKDLIYAVTTVENKNQFNVLFDEAGNFKEFRIYIPNVVEFPLNITEDYTIDETYFNNVLDVEIPKSADENQPKENLSSPSQGQPLTKELQKKIDKQFNPWSGAHINLVKIVKNTLNDPKSFEHQKTKYLYDEQTGLLTIGMEYRANNQLGNPILTTVIVKADIDGNIIEVIEE